jgi:hypothetical protein
MKKSEAMVAEIVAQLLANLQEIVADDTLDAITNGKGLLKLLTI